MILTTTKNIHHNFLVVFLALFHKKSLINNKLLFYEFIDKKRIV
jgi:hypothetical protein